jgi:hypothetical protein
MCCPTTVVECVVPQRWLNVLTTTEVETCFPTTTRYPYELSLGTALGPPAQPRDKPIGSNQMTPKTILTELVRITEIINHKNNDLSFNWTAVSCISTMYLFQ